MLAVDPLVGTATSRGIEVDWWIDSVSFSPGSPPAMDGTSAVRIQFSNRAGGNLPRGAYTGGVDVITPSGQAPGTSLQLTQGLPQNGQYGPVLQTCTLTPGAQRCTGWFNTLAPGQPVITVRLVGGSQFTSTSLRKIVVDVP